MPTSMYSGFPEGVGAVVAQAVRIAAMVNAERRAKPIMVTSYKDAMRRCLQNTTKNLLGWAREA